MDIRRFAESGLSLPAGGQYLAYADLGRPFAVYSVFAAPEFSLTPKTWCYPVIGCAAYRGYFSATAAREYAAGLREASYDVYVAGVPAYSTLGWFRDPVLNTFIHREPADLAALVFHELAHQVLYVQDDTTFNESFATAVEQEGVKRWVEAHGSPEKLAQFQQSQARRRQFVALVLKYQGRLAAIYASSAADDEKRALKAQTFAAMRADYVELKRSWGMPSGYDAWFAGPLNNAQIASVASYTQQVQAFQALLAQEQGDMKRFHAAAQALARLPKPERDAKLAALGAPMTATTLKR
jgi:predicted aminopeptidase